MDDISNFPGITTSSLWLRIYGRIHNSIIIIIIIIMLLGKVARVAVFRDQAIMAICVAGR
jgi:hypothetical protein